MHRAIALAAAVTLATGTLLLAAPAHAQSTDERGEDPTTGRPWDDTVSGYALVGVVAAVAGVVAFAAMRARTHPHHMRGDPLGGALSSAGAGVGSGASGAAAAPRPGYELGGCCP